MSQTVAEKYESLTSQTYVAKDQTFARTVIGDEKQTEFHPQVKLERWDNEVNFSVRLVHEEKAVQVRAEDGKIKWIGAKQEAHFYEVGHLGEDGGFEFEVICHERPKNDQVQMTIQTKGLEFFYQPPLKNLNPDGSTWEDNGRGGIRLRPANVNGSYAVYHRTMAGDYSRIGGKNYKAGKFCHIYGMPRLEDAKGNWVWGSLDIDVKAGLLTVSAPEKFWAEAVYPVRHAAGLEFGYHTKGGTSGSGDFAICKFQAPENGNISAITSYIYNYSGSSLNANMGYYNDNSGVVGTHVAHGTAASIANGFNDWKELSVAGAITGNSYYWPCVQLSPSGSNIDCYFDTTGTANQFGYINSHTFDNWADSPVQDSYEAWIFSIFATYTAAGGGLSIPVAMATYKRRWSG
jgi:hypothetical protein